MRQNVSHNLEHIIGLSLVAQRLRITANAGIAEIKDLLLVDEDGIFDAFNATTNASAMCKTRIWALKRWVQNRSDEQQPMEIILFTPSVCRERQMELGRTSKTQGCTDKLVSTPKKITHI